MGPEHVVLCLTVVALGIYALLGGADFGGGIWEFNTAFMAGEDERTLIRKAMGPVWEANHVWLIFAVILIMNGFPIVLAAVSRALCVPLGLALVGIVFRGAAFVFTAYLPADSRQASIWRGLFAIASTAAPFFLGVSIGAVASGHLPLDADGDFTGDYLTSWMSPLAWFSGFFAVAVCCYLSAFYLVREANVREDEKLTALWRQRALVTGLWTGVLAMVGLALLAGGDHSLWTGFRARGWPLIVASVAFGLYSLYAMRVRHYNRAVFGAGATVATVLLGWTVSQYPAILPPHLTVSNTPAPENVLWMMVIGAFAGTAILLPSLIWLFVIFKRFDEGK